MVFPLASETVGRPPRTCGPGAALGVLRIAKNVSTAVVTSFVARRLWQDDHHAQLQLFHTYDQISTLEEPLYRYRPAQGASASCLPQSSRSRVDRGMVRLRALPAHSAFAASWFSVARLARGRLLLVASENNRWTTFLFIIQRSGRDKNGAAGGRPRSLATVAAARSWPVARDRSPA
jgi:hypothetical protein